MESMKKNLATIFLLMGAVALNLGVLCQAHAGSRARDGKAAVMAAVRNAAALFAEHDGGDVAGSIGESSQGLQASGCACAADDSGTQIHLNLSVHAAGLSPQGPSLKALSAVAPVFSSPPSIPQDRPPRPSA